MNFFTKKQSGPVALDVVNTMNSDRSRMLTYVSRPDFEDLEPILLQSYGQKKDFPGFGWGLVPVWLEPWSFLNKLLQFKKPKMCINISLRALILFCFLLGGCGLLDSKSPDFEIGIIEWVNSDTDNQAQKKEKQSDDFQIGKPDEMIEVPDSI